MLSGQCIFNAIYLRSWSGFRVRLTPHRREGIFHLAAPSWFMPSNIQAWMEAMHSWKILLITREKLEFNPPAGPEPSPSPAPAAPFPSHCASKFSRPGKRQLLFECGFTDGFYRHRNSPIAFPAGRRDSWTGGQLRSPSPSALWDPHHQTGLPKVWDKSRVTLRTQKTIIKRDSPRHFPSYPK